MKLLISGLSLGLLVGCGSVVPSTLAHLYGMSPLEADPAAIAIRASLPDGIGLLPGQSFLTVQSENPARGLDVSERFIIEARDTDDGMTVLRIAPEDLSDLAVLQTQLRDYETTDPRGTSGSLSVFLGLCRFGAGPTPDARFSIDLQTEVDGRYSGLVRDAQIADVADELGIESLPECETAGLAQ